MAPTDPIIPASNEKPIWYKLTANDLYNFVTALYVFIVTMPIIWFELKKDVPTVVTVKIAWMEFPNVPTAMYLVIIAVSATTIVNYFRSLLSIVYIKLIKGKE